MAKRQLNVMIDEDTFEKAKNKCNENKDISMPFIVETLLNAYIEGTITIQKKTIIDIQVNRTEEK